MRELGRVGLAGAQDQVGVLPRAEPGVPQHVPRHRRRQVVQLPAGRDAHDGAVRLPLRRGRLGWRVRGVGQAGQQGAHLAVDRLQPLERQRVARQVGLRQGQAAQGDPVVVLGRGPRAHRTTGLQRQLRRVALQCALIEGLGRGQRRAVAQHHLQERQRLHVLARNHQAHRQGRGDQQADRPPHERPERRRQHHGDGGQACAMAVQQRLDHLAHQQVAQQEQAEHHDRQRPPGRDGQRQQHRRHDGDDAAYVGHEPHQRRQYPPQHRVRQPHPPQPGGDEHAERRIERQLEQEVAGQPPRRVVHRQDRPVQVLPPDQAHHPVPQVLTRQQHEHREHDDHAQRRQRAEQRRHDGADDAERGRRGGVAGRAVHRGRRPGGLPSGHAGQQRLDGAADAPDRLRADRQRLDLVLDGGLVGRQAFGQGRRLAPDDGADAQDGGKRQRHRNQHRRSLAHAGALQQHDQGRQHEGQQHRQHERHEQVAPEIQRGDHDGTRIERLQAGRPGPALGHAGIHGVVVACRRHGLDVPGRWLGPAPRLRDVDATGGSGHRIRRAPHAPGAGSRDQGVAGRGP